MLRASPLIEVKTIRTECWDKEKYERNRAARESCVSAISSNTDENFNAHARLANVDIHSFQTARVLDRQYLKLAYLGYFGIS